LKEESVIGREREESVRGSHSVTIHFTPEG
jgi:hypothetical protein